MNSLETLNVLRLSCLTADVNIRSSGQIGPSRSIVRWIASKLPLAPAKRFYIHAFEVGHLRNNNIHHLISRQWPPSLELIKPRKRSDSGISSSSECDLLWHARDFVTVADIPQLIHEKSSLDIRLRCEHCFLLSPSPNSDMETNSVISNLPEPQMIMNPSTDRILELEIELAKLRQQLAAIVRVQEQGAATAVDFSFLPPGMTSSPISSCPDGGMPHPPPPPPPPPPPLPLTPAISIIDIIRKNKAKSSACRLVVASNKPNIDMTEILKDMGKIKLRQIARSPGGTPLKQNVDLREANDTASFIASALRKKFAKVQHHHGNENQSFSSPDDRTSSWSPITENNHTPPGPHLLKSRRSNLLKPMMENPCCQLEVVAE